MKLTQHPEYPIFTWAKETDQRCREAVAAWKASGKSIWVEEHSLRWTFERAQIFTRSLSCLIQEYNHVLWERFPYCRQCGGHCCRVGAAASTIDEFDSIALALLGQSRPELPEEIEATKGDCIYRAARGCAWPAEWRMVKCWSFFCLGQSEHQKNECQKLPDLSRKRRNKIVDELRWVVLDLLPAPLRRYEDIWASSLKDYVNEPDDFVEIFNTMLFEVFISPFNDHYPIIEE